MRKKSIQQKWGMLILGLLIVSFSAGCVSPNTQEEKEEPKEKIAPIEITQDEFQRVVGWLNNEEILVHIGTVDSHQLLICNLFSGESRVFIEEQATFLGVDIAPGRDRIFVQQIMENENQLCVFFLDKTEEFQLSIEQTVPVQVDWNPRNPEWLFLTYYGLDEENKQEFTIERWNTFTNERIKMQNTGAIYPKWYSQHLYVFMKEGTGELYLGDTRSDDPPLMINQEIVDFYLDHDALLSVAESDIRDEEVHIFREHPLLVHAGVVTFPKLTANNKVIIPRFALSQNSDVAYAVKPDQAYNMDKEEPEFSLVKIDFEEESIHRIEELPDNVPLQLSPEETYLLYGWQLENIVILDDEISYPLIKNQ